jgi:hypothetical protein
MLLRYADYSKELVEIDDGVSVLTIYQAEA